MAGCRITSTARTLSARLLGQVDKLKILDLRGSDTNRLELNQSLIALLGGGSELRVVADADGTVTASGTWQRSGTVTIGKVNFGCYFDGASRVDIQRGASVDSRCVLALSLLNGEHGVTLRGGGWVLDAVTLDIAGVLYRSYTNTAAAQLLLHPDLGAPLVKSPPPVVRLTAHRPQRHPHQLVL